MSDHSIEISYYDCYVSQCLHRGFQLIDAYRRPLDVHLILFVSYMVRILTASPPTWSTQTTTMEQYV